VELGGGRHERRHVVDRSQLAALDPVVVVRRLARAAPVDRRAFRLRRRQHRQHRQTGENHNQHYSDGRTALTLGTRTDRVLSRIKYQRRTSGRRAYSRAH